MSRPNRLIAFAALLAASTLPVRAGDPAPARAADPAAPAADAAGDAPQAEHAVVRDCVRETGSLIHPSNHACTGAAGDAYAHDDLESSGQSTMGSALSQVDPRISVRGR